MEKKNLFYSFNILCHVITSADIFLLQDFIDTDESVLLGICLSWVKKKFLVRIS